MLRANEQEIEAATPASEARRAHLRSMSGDQLRALMRERDALAASTTYQIEISPEEYAQLRHATLHNRRCFGERDNLSNNELVVDPALSLVMGKCAAITDAEWRRRHPDEGTEMTERSERK